MKYFISLIIILQIVILTMLFQFRCNHEPNIQTGHEVVATDDTAPLSFKEIHARMTSNYQKAYTSATIEDVGTVTKINQVDDGYHVII